MAHDRRNFLYSGQLFGSAVAGEGCRSLHEDTSCWQATYMAGRWMSNDLGFGNGMTQPTCLIQSGITGTGRLQMREIANKHSTSTCKDGNRAIPGQLRRVNGREVTRDDKTLDLRGALV